MNHETHPGKWMLRGAHHASQLEVRQLEIDKINVMDGRVTKVY